MAQVPAGTKFLGVDPNFTDLKERKGTKVDRQTEYFSLEDITATVGVGSEGPQGIQGPAGPPGPVGPAGLEWQGAWDTNSSYAVNDAVGFNGASWFCISEVTGTGNSNPEEDTVSWALLAAQGAVGPQGAQGPTGPQGPQGPTGPQGAQGNVIYTEESVTTESISIAQDTDGIGFDLGKITKNFTRAFVSSPTNNYLGLSNVGKIVGDFFVVRNQSTTTSINVLMLNNARLLGTNGFETVQTFEIKPNTYARFTLINTTGGSDKVFMVEVINPLGDIQSLIINTTTSALSLSTLNSTYATNPIGTRVVCRSISGGGLVYTKTASNAWVSQSVTAVS